MKTNSIITSIRRRLFTLLVRAFSAVVTLLVVLILLITGFFLFYSDANSPFDQLRIITRLETFYLANASWEGVEDIFSGELPETDIAIWQGGVLLASDSTIIAYRGSTEDARVGQEYKTGKNDTFIPIILHGDEIGQFVLVESITKLRGRFPFNFLAPIIFISFFLAILTVIIGVFLMRRVINPLAEVIAAAGKVAGGDLSARVPVSGPDDLRALSDSFNHMAETLELNDRERRDLLADIAHELRTPLTVIRGRLEGIVDGIYPAEGTQISPALEETYLLERLVEDLRLLTLAETRQLQFEPCLVSLGKLAEHAIGIFSAEAGEKKISLNLTNNAPNTEIEVDPQRTEQVIGNLISNALRYVPEGGEVQVLVERTDDSVSLHISDNGPGVPKEDLPHLFLRFWRGEKSRSRASGGAGLGLAIASQLVEAQGGKISAMNSSEGGLKVTVAFPFEV